MRTLVAPICALSKLTITSALLALLGACGGGGDSGSVGRESPASFGSSARGAKAPLYTVTDLGTLGGSQSYAYAINDKGQVTGTSAIDAIGFEYHPFVYSGGTMKDLGTIGGLFNYGRGDAINNKGEVAETFISSSQRAWAFLYSGGSMQRLGDFGAGETIATGINKKGQVTGFSFLPLEIGTRALLYGGGTTQDLGTLGGSYSGGYGINDKGQVTVGGPTWSAMLQRMHFCTATEA